MPYRPPHPPPPADDPSVRVVRAPAPQRVGERPAGSGRHPPGARRGGLTQGCMARWVMRPGPGRRRGAAQPASGGNGSWRNGARPLTRYLPGTSGAPGRAPRGAMAWPDGADGRLPGQSTRQPSVMTMPQDPLALLCIEPRFPGKLGAVADWLVRKRGYRCTFYCASADGRDAWPASAGAGLDVVPFNVGGAGRESSVHWTRGLERGLCYAFGCFEAAGGPPARSAARLRPVRGTGRPAAARAFRRGLRRRRRRAGRAVGTEFPMGGLGMRRAKR